MSRRWRSRSTPCRLRITGWPFFRRSPTSCASLKPRGSITCTRVVGIGIAFTAADCAAGAGVAGAGSSRSCRLRNTVSGLDSAGAGAVDGRRARAPRARSPRAPGRRTRRRSTRRPRRSTRRRRRGPARPSSCERPTCGVPSVVLRPGSVAAGYRRAARSRPDEDRTRRCRRARCVAPSAIAGSKSPLIPIEHSRSPRSSVRRRSARKCGVGSPLGGRHGHEPLDVEPEVATARRRAPGASPGAQPPFCASPPTFTCTSTAAPGRMTRRSRAELVAVDRVPQRDARRDRSAPCCAAAAR